MLDAVRKYVEAGREAITPKKAEELARALARQGQARADQVQQLAKDLAEWSRKSSERWREAIKGEVQKQVSKAGVATKDEIESLKRRIRRLESEAKPAARTSAATAPKPPAAKPPAAKPAGAKPAGAKPAGAKPPAAKPARKSSAGAPGATPGGPTATGPTPGGTGGTGGGTTPGL